MTATFCKLARVAKIARLAVPGLLMACPHAFAAEPLPPPPPPLYALLVGGGPDRDDNAAQIEGHVRFAGQLLAPAAKCSVLFADGKPESPSVSYLELEKVPGEKTASAVQLIWSLITSLPCAGRHGRRARSGRR